VASTSNTVDRAFDLSKKENFRIILALKFKIELSFQLHSISGSLCNLLKSFKKLHGDVLWLSIQWLSRQHWQHWQHWQHS